MEFTGIVVAGDGRGRTIGFPTANLSLTAGQQVPRGVFSGCVCWDDEPTRRVVINVGSRPTFTGSDTVAVEVHVLDFDGDLYGRALVVRLGQKLRDEQRFGSVQELTQQIAVDIERARADGPCA